VVSLLYIRTLHTSRLAILPDFLYRLINLWWWSMTTSFYDFIDILQRTHARQNLDLHILFTGPEGSGKSATAFATAAHCDPQFIHHVDNRLLLDTSEFDNVYVDLNDRVEELKAGKNTNSLRFYQLDETQNLLQNRNAMSKHNKNVVQLIMTMRAVKASLLYCTPDITSIEKTVLRRVSLIIGCNRDELYIFINKLNFNGKLYEGTAQRLLYKMNEYKKKYGLIPDLTLEMCSRLKTHPDIIANVEFDKKLYDIYEKYKLEKTQRFLEEKKEENEPKTENTTTAQTHNTNMLEQKGIVIVDGGNYLFNEEIDNTLYTHEYYYFQAVRKLLNISDNALRNRMRNAGISTIKDKRKSYILGKDLLKVVQ